MGAFDAYERHHLQATTGPTHKNLLAYAKEENNDALIAYLEKG